MGLRVVAQWSGDGTLSEMELTPKVKLNLIHCYRSMNYMCKVMEEKWGIPWLEYNFFGPTKIAESLRAIAARFDDKIKEGAERVIAKYQAEYEAVIHSLRAARALGAVDVALRSDSELLVRQINGQYRVRNERLIRLHRAARELIQVFRRFEARHVGRDENTAADAQAI